MNKDIRAFITEEHIEDHANPAVVERGWDYFQDQLVKLIEVQENSVVAHVFGKNLYVVELSIEYRQIYATCSCPYDWGGYCKHIVATMFALIDCDVKVQPKKEPEWRISLQQLLPIENIQTTQVPKQKPWRLAYAIRVERDIRRILPVRIKIAKDGSDEPATELHQYNVHDGVHFDLTDRMIIPKIQNGFSNNIAQDLMFGNRKSWEYAYGPSWMNRDGEMSDILQLLKTKEFYLADKQNLRALPLKVLETPAVLHMVIKEIEKKLTISAELRLLDTAFPISSNWIILSKSPLWMIINDQVVRVEKATGNQMNALQKQKKTITIPAKGRATFLQEGLPLLASRYVLDTPQDLIRTIDVNPLPCVFLREVDGQLRVECRFRYEDIDVWHKQTDQVVGGDQNVLTEYFQDKNIIVNIRRRMEEEEKMFAVFQSASVKIVEQNNGNDQQAQHTPTIHPLEWLFTELPKLRTNGFHIYGEESLIKHRLRSSKPAIAATVSSGIDWFDLSIDLQFEGTPASFDAFVRAIEKGDRFIPLEDGSFGALPEIWLRRFQRTKTLVSPDDRSWKLSRAQIGAIDEVLEDADQSTADEEFIRLRERLRSFTSIQPQALPVGFQGSLRPYQKAGYDWLHFLREFGFGGILADDMGLGKTVQTLALLQKLYEDGAQEPSLIIVPTSLIFNWENEAKHFTPNLKVYSHHGFGRIKEHTALDGMQVIVSSYGILRRDMEFLKNIQFLIVVLDESQNIKNPKSINAKAVRILRTKQRLALSGTPVENNLMDLWSQFTFLNPGMLGSVEAFSSNYARPIERAKDESTTSALKRLVFPFILRRTKELVEKDLPPKQESVVMCEMDKGQKHVYDHWREYFRRAVLKNIEQIGFQRSKFMVLEGLMKLRQICCHPVLIDSAYQGSSGKYDAFTEMLEDVLSEEHKVLVFSQFVKMLTVLRKHCDRTGIIYEYLDGRTKDRQVRVKRFQSEENVRLFLISLKAGGFGLNLTAADYVIHYDPWWNPAVEMQATDRTHRIGQTKNIFSYKLITKDSVEEKILSLQERKRELVKSIITTEGGFMKSLTKEDVEVLFG